MSHFGVIDVRMIVSEEEQPVNIKPDKKLDKMSFFALNN